MDLTIFAGKGGVGKSTSAAAYATHKSDDGPVVALDYDGGHSLGRVFCLDERPPSNERVPTGIEQVDLVVVDPIRYIPVDEFKQRGGDTKGYLAQFPEDYGLGGFCNMVTTFFGVPTDVASVLKFASLTNAYQQAREQGTRHMVIDVEPTAGLEQLLQSSDAIARSLTNLQRTGLMKLSLIGAMWPDIKAFIAGSYIKQADKYVDRMNETAEALRSASYQLVCIPEQSPVEEMGDVAKVIESVGGTIDGYIINNIRGGPHEAANIERVERTAGEKPIIKIQRDERLCSTTRDERLQALRDIGKKFE